MNATIPPIEKEKQRLDDGRRFIFQLLLRLRQTLDKLWSRYHHEFTKLRQMYELKKTIIFWIIGTPLLFGTSYLARSVSPDHYPNKIDPSVFNASTQSDHFFAREISY